MRRMRALRHAILPVLLVASCATAQAMKSPLRERLEKAGTSEVEVEGTIYTMRAGSFLRIPKGARHRILSASADFIGINLFSPATV